MFTFRQKIFLSYVIVFLIFIALMCPFASHTVKNIVRKTMTDRANELIAVIKNAPNDEALIRRLKEQKHLMFFRVSIITNEKKILYDSHIKRLLGPKFSQEHITDNPEVLEAFQMGTGYHEDYSDLLGQRFAYLAKSFDFHGKNYVMRTAFPYKYMVELTDDFELGFIGLSTAVLLLFSIMTWFIINRLLTPIQQIIEAVKPYQDGHQDLLPQITIYSKNPADEVAKLATTLNSLSARIRKQIETLTLERNEKVAILESLAEAVIAVNQNMVITYANTTAGKFLKIDPAEVIGKNFKTIAYSNFYELLVMCQKEGKPLTEEISLKQEGGKVYYDVIASPTQGNVGAILVLQCKTAHYRILEMRKDFIANASHELKTPVTVIRGFAETLHDHPNLPVETTIEITEKIVRNCIRMTKLIKDLLTLADIENIPQSRLLECDLLDLLEGCLSLVQDAYPDANIVVHKIPEDGDFQMTGDPQLLEMAIMNLVENAAKYSPKPAQITITIERIGDTIKLSIADKGIGIPKADIEHIFQRFYTVDKAHSQKMGGSGLGLSLVETIIDKHFGKISLESEVGVGTTFYLSFPVSREI